MSKTNRGFLIFKLSFSPPLTVRGGQTCWCSVTQLEDLFKLLSVILEWPQNTVCQVCPKQQEFTPVIHNRVYHIIPYFLSFLFSGLSHHNSFLSEIRIIGCYHWRRNMLNKSSFTCSWHSSSSHLMSPVCIIFMVTSDHISSDFCLISSDVFCSINRAWRCVSATNFQTNDKLWPYCGGITMLILNLTHNIVTLHLLHCHTFSVLLTNYHWRPGLTPH